ncbi:MAG TPA: TonB-dependent receptor [Caulobacteraceae bacterium]|nr:TonB-dependent receptor [Caulobacteraceae bacterium]
MKNARISLKSLALGSCALGALIAAAAPAAAAEFAVSPQDLQPALQQFASQGDQQVLFSSAAVAGKSTAGFTGDAPPETALQQLLSGTDLVWSKTTDGALLVMTEQEARARRPQFAQAASGGGAEVEALIVTAQKREEDIQDVPIAISAFSQEDLTRSQVAGGPDLITQIPNFTFTKTNFTGYSIQIRGIGTQAISATTDPAVAVALNNTPFIRNRFFEQEFYDLQRVEVLRGPQGTLYGRNATAGVVTIISAKPKFSFEAKVSGDVGNYNSTRLEGMVNIPLVEDAVALRVAGAWTKRDGYSFNELTGRPIDGRDLWSSRVSLRFTPNDALDINLLWEHFEENDDRLRSGKQLCKKHVVTEIDGMPVTYDQHLGDYGQAGGIGGVQSTFSQGCIRNSLYAQDSFETVNGYSVPYYRPLRAIGLPAARLDPYVGTVQSRNLRSIESAVDPDYRANSDIAQLQVSFDIADGLTLQSETSYGIDEAWSMQDFNRFNTAPGAWTQPQAFDRPGVLLPGELGGVFCDPQLGCSDRLVAVDLSTATARQLSQEFRLSSDFDGAFNFSLGANFLRADIKDRYYVFINSLTLFSALGFNLDDHSPYVGGQSDNMDCLSNGPEFGSFTTIYGVGLCTYLDPNPIGSLNDQGHNYFLSNNPYKLISYAVFGEAYYELSDNLKITGGLRWTVDKKEAPRIPSWTLAPNSYGYPVAEVIEQEWREPTGRLAIDWKPVLPFTDETLIYGSYAHGYKAGGANPPRFVAVAFGSLGIEAIAREESSTRPKVFKAEFIDAFEIGAKNTVLDGTATLNLAAFYYDYQDYQMSEIVDRSAFNRNFDATVWGVEVEADWRPLENLKLGFKGGYQKTRIADGEQAIDLMDRTAGREGWAVVRPFPTFASSCILPEYLYSRGGTTLLGVGSPNGGGGGGCEFAYLRGLDPITEKPNVPDPAPPYRFGAFPNYPGFNPFDPEINGGEGFLKDLSGNELPNAPNWTGTITADYTVPLVGDWLMNLHTDLHWQAESWWRIFNDHEYNKLDEYFTMNLAAIFTNEEAGWNIMAYVKNVTDETALTGAFLNSDDTGLTTNVFLTEPRLYGLRVTKAWSGGPLLGGFGGRSDGPRPFALELGGQLHQIDAPTAPISPAFLDAPAPGGTDPQFSPAIDPRGIGRDFDLGEGREIRLTYAPEGSWSVALGLRQGRTKGSHPFARLEEEGDRTCEYNLFRCDPAVQGPLIRDNYSVSEIYEREEYTVLDFMVGKDVGLGALTGSSRLAAGLKHAELSAETDSLIFGMTNWDFPVDIRFKYTTLLTPHDRFESRLDIEREFEGTGPALSWEASQPLLGLEQSGVLGLDWSLTGGVLFGDRKVSITGEEQHDHFESPQQDVRFPFETPVSTVITPVSIQRSENTSVPVFGAELGLSYSLDRMKLRAGYRWERYFDAIDGGYDEARDEDRTIDGPYFKLSIGFGGG